MARKEYDPLDFVPDPQIIRERLTRTLSLAERLRILLELSERLNATDGQPLDLDTIRTACVEAGFLSPRRSERAHA